jgi:hypothetical protein
MLASGTLTTLRGIHVVEQRMAALSPERLVLEAKYEALMADCACAAVGGGGGDGDGKHATYNKIKSLFE